MSLGGTGAARARPGSGLGPGPDGGPGWGPSELTAVELREAIAGGSLSAEAAMEACLARIAEVDGRIGAFAHVDPQHALTRAREADRWRKAGRPLGPLHGVPVGVKDIIDTADMPTENGTPIDHGRRPQRDAHVVSRLRSAGAIVVGKTATTELAYFSPAKTANPIETSRTPGGSSSGSAAAVAASMVPLALGTQTNGSVIRPASFCGVVGIKPSFGLIGRSGALRQAEALDTIGSFARTLEDAALLAEVCQGFDPADDATRPAAHQPLFEAARTAPPVAPTFAFVRSPVWERAAPDAKAAIEELAARLGERCDEVALPEVFANAHPAQRTVMVTGFARNLRRYADRGWDALSEVMREAISEGRAVSAVDYLAALDWRTVLQSGLSRVFERYDAILTLSAAGQAPRGLEATGDPSFNTIWTFCGTPAVSLPLAHGEDGLPIGVQLVGRPGEDARLMRVANWLLNELARDEQ